MKGRGGRRLKWTENGNDICVDSGETQIFGEKKHLDETIGGSTPVTVAVF